MRGTPYPFDSQPNQAARVRVLRESDLAQVLQIENRAYEFPWSAAIFADCFKAGYAGLALEQEGELIGYGMISHAAREAHLLNVAIAPQWQGAGHGRHLTRRMIDLARWHQAEQMFLEVRVSNKKAYALYQSLGFCEIGTRPNYYPGRGKREDAIVMAIDLSLRGFTG